MQTASARLCVTVLRVFTMLPHQGLSPDPRGEILIDRGQNFAGKPRGDESAQVDK